jgi:hypothetical protein
MTRFAKNLFRTQLCIFAVIFLPPIFFFFRYSTSLAFGVLVASVLIYILAPRKYVLTTLDLKILILVALVILVHSFIVLGLMEFDIDRAITSLALLLIVMLAGMSLGRMMLEMDQQLLNKVIQGCFLMLCIIGFLPYLNLQLFEQTSNNFGYLKPFFPFVEPSHFALIFLPFILYGCSKNEGYKKYIPIILGFIIGSLMQSMTLLAGCILICLIFPSKSPKKFIVAAIVFGIFLFPMIDFSYYQARLPVSDEHTLNLSWLVFQQGWELIYESIKSSIGFGIGFQQLGVNTGYEKIETSNLINQLAGGYMNILDGGFNLAKIVSEFGFLGALLICFYIWISLRAILEINKKYNTTAQVFSCSILVAYTVELFIRGVGYFSSNSIFLIAAFYIFWQSKVPRNKINPSHYLDLKNLEP